MPGNRIVRGRGMTAREVELGLVPERMSPFQKKTFLDGLAASLGGSWVEQPSNNGTRRFVLSRSAKPDLERIQAWAGKVLTGAGPGPYEPDTPADFAQTCQVLLETASDARTRGDLEEYAWATLRLGAKLAQLDLKLYCETDWDSGKRQREGSEKAKRERDASAAPGIEARNKKIVRDFNDPIIAKLNKTQRRKLVAKINGTSPSTVERALGLKK